MKRSTRTFNWISIIYDSHYHLTWLLLPVITLGATTILPTDSAIAQAQRPKVLILSDIIEGRTKLGATFRGNVKISYPSQKFKAVANLANYNIEQEQIVISGDVSILQDRNTMEGEIVTYTVKEGKFLVKPKSGKQVRSNIVPKQGGKGLTIYSNIQEADTKAEIITAQGKVRLIYPGKKLQALANNIKYNYRTQGEQIVLSGNATIFQNGSSLQAETITYFVDEDRFVAKQKPGVPVKSIYVIPDDPSKQ